MVGLVLAGGEAQEHAGGLAAGQVGHVARLGERVGDLTGRLLPTSRGGSEGRSGHRLVWNGDGKGPFCYHKYKSYYATLITRPSRRLVCMARLKNKTRQHVYPCEVLTSILRRSMRAVPWSAMALEMRAAASASPSARMMDAFEAQREKGTEKRRGS